MLELRWVFLSPHLLQWWVSHRPEAVPCTQGWLSQPRKGQGSEQWGLLQKLFLQIIWNRWGWWWCNNDEDASIHTSSICSLFIYMESLLSRHRAREQYLFTWPRQCLRGIQGYSPWGYSSFHLRRGFLLLFTCPGNNKILVQGNLRWGRSRNAQNPRMSVNDLLCQWLGKPASTNSAFFLTLTAHPSFWTCM